MTAERWGRIEALFHAALEQEPASRAAFLAGSCGDDADLRREVESLLAQEGGGRILNQPLSAVAAEVLAPAERCAPGAMIGPYRIIEPLGQRAAWARSIAPPILGSAAMSRSSFSPPISSQTPKGDAASSAKRARLRR